MSSYLPVKDEELLRWVNNFVAVATTNKTLLGLTTADLDAISGTAANFTNNLDMMTSLKAQFESQVTDKDANRAEIVGDVRPMVKRIQANTDVTDTLKTQLGITVSSGIINRTPPVQPAALAATPQADGTNVLKWNKAGNKQTTQFVVYAKPLTDGASITADSGWTIVGQTTKTNFAHQGVTPGMPMAYKVMAVRAGDASVPSIPATVYTS